MGLERYFKLGLLVICGGCQTKNFPDTGGTGGTPVDTTEDTAGECSGTAPQVVDMWCDNSGIQEHYETGEDTVTMELWVEVSDEDGDFHQYSMQIYYDEELDESIDTSDSNFSPISSSVEADECEAFSAQVGVTLYLTGSDPDYDTTYEWGVVVEDAAGLESDVGIVQCITPQSDGTDGAAPTDTASARSSGQ